MTTINDPSRIDVYLGRGMRVYRMPGNMRYRQIILAYRDTFKQATNDGSKGVIIRQAYREIKYGLMPHYTVRFLELQSLAESTSKASEQSALTTSDVGIDSPSANADGTISDRKSAPSSPESKRRTIKPSRRSQGSGRAHTSHQGTLPGGQWVEVNESVAMAKVHHALREKRSPKVSTPQETRELKVILDEVIGAHKVGPIDSSTTSSDDADRRHWQRQKKHFEPPSVYERRIVSPRSSMALSTLESSTSSSSGETLQPVMLAPSIPNHGCPLAAPSTVVAHQEQQRSALTPVLDTFSTDDSSIPYSMAQREIRTDQFDPFTDDFTPVQVDRFNYEPTKYRGHDIPPFSVPSDYHKHNQSTGFTDHSEGNYRRLSWLSTDGLDEMILETLMDKSVDDKANICELDNRAEDVDTIASTATAFTAQSFNDRIARVSAADVCNPSPSEIDDSWLDYISQLKRGWW